MDQRAEEDGRALTRRRLLSGAALTVAAGFAGCQGSEDTTTPTETATPTATATRTATPTATTTPELPNVERRIVQRDRAAITHINTIVSGTMQWPSHTVVDPTAVYGTWEQRGGEETLQFTPDRTFTITSPEDTVEGEYAVRQGRILILTANERSIRYEYEQREGESGTIIRFTRDGDPVGEYQRTSQPDLDVVDAIQALELRREEGPEATVEGGDLRSGATGSGFFVTPDGYVLTNAHVILADRDPDQLLFDRVAEASAAGIREAAEENFADSDLTDAERREIEEVLFDKLLSYYAEYSRLSGVETDVNVLNGRTTPGEDITVASWSASVEAEGTVRTEVDGQQTWGRDVAVLKTSANHLPSVTLGTSDNLDTGDELFVIGYPSIGIQDLFEESEQVLEPTLTTGVVSARRTLKSGINTIQTEAAINSGNSGGPMYDRNGEVVGMATFGPADANIQDIKFGLPIETAIEFLDDLGVENTSGEMDTAFDEGLEAYWRGDCETATDRMETVLDLYPDHPYAQRYIDNCESGDAPGQ